MQRTGGLAALIGVTAFLAIVLPLHFLQPGYEPANRLMSELALGRYGWTMILGLRLARSASR